MMKSAATARSQIMMFPVPCRSIKQHRLALRAPRGLVDHRQRIQIARSCLRIVHPAPQQVAAVDDVDGEPVLLVLVRKIAPDGVIRLQPSQSFECERKQSPWFEPLMV